MNERKWVSLTACTLLFTGSRLLPHHITTTTQTKTLRCENRARRIFPYFLVFSANVPKNTTLNGSIVLQCNAFRLI